jgi:hypothetical protein
MVTLLNGGEPVTVTNVRDADSACEVELVSGRQVWLCSKAVRLLNGWSCRQPQGNGTGASTEDFERLR